MCKNSLADKDLPGGKQSVQVKPQSPSYTAVFTV